MAILILEDKACSKFGGAEKSMFKYIEHLNKIGQEVVLVYDRKGSWLDDDNITNFIDVLRLDLRPLRSQGLNYYETFIALKSFCNRHKIQKIFTHTVHCFPLLRLVKLSCKVEINVYFKWVVNYENLGIMNNWGLKAIDNAFGNSQFVVNYWLRKKINCSIPLLPNGISVPKNFHPETSFEKLNTILFVGRIYEGKGLLELVEILPSLRNFNLIVCGFFNAITKHDNIAYHKKLQDRIAELNLESQIDFKGFVRNPIEYMTSETIVVIPSIWPESSSRVLYEAMMNKTSVIASELGGMGDVLGEMSKFCLVNPCKDKLLVRIREFEKMNLANREKIADYLFNRFNENYNMSLTHQRLDDILL